VKHIQFIVVLAVSSAVVGTGGCAYTGISNGILKAGTSPIADAQKNQRGSSFAARAFGQRKSEKEFQSQIAMARLLERRDNYAAAEKMFVQLAKEYPEEPLASHRLGVIFAKRGKFDDAHKHFQKARAVTAPSAQLLGDIGYTYYLQHELDKAESVLLEAIELATDDEAITNNLGLVYGMQGKHEESLAMFKRAGTAAEAYANLAYVNVQDGDLGEAEANFGQSLSLDSKLRSAAHALVQLADNKRQRTIRQRTVPTEESGNTPEMIAAKSDSSRSIREAPLPVAELAKKSNRQPVQLASVNVASNASKLHLTKQVVHTRPVKTVPAPKQLAKIIASPAPKTNPRRKTSAAIIQSSTDLRKRSSGNPKTVVSRAAFIKAPVVRGSSLNRAEAKTASKAEATYASKRDISTGKKASLRAQLVSAAGSINSKIRGTARTLRTKNAQRTPVTQKTPLVNGMPSSTRSTRDKPVLKSSRRTAKRQATASGKSTSVAPKKNPVRPKRLPPLPSGVHKSKDPAPQPPPPPTAATSALEATLAAKTNMLSPAYFHPTQSTRPVASSSATFTTARPTWTAASARP